MPKGETVDTLEVFGLKVTLRFVDWDRPDHRDMQGYAVPRYSLHVEDAETGETVTFTTWGSIHQATQQEYDDDAGRHLGLAVGDAMMWYDAGGEDPTDSRVTVSSLQNELADVVDEMAEQWSIESPSEAVRTLGVVMDSARKFRKVNTHRDGLGTLHGYLAEQGHV